MRISYFGGKSWAGAGSRSLGGYMPSDDERLAWNLTAEAWREDPRPLAHTDYADMLKQQRARARKHGL